MDEEKQAAEEPVNGKKSTFEKVLIAGVCITFAIFAVMLFEWVRPMLCSHDFDRTGKEEATCTGNGKICYKCKLCGQTKTELIDPLGHDMRYESSETMNVGDSVYEQTTDACERCGHTETGEWEYWGSIVEYHIHMEVGMWLISEGSYGSALLKENTIISYDSDKDYYHVSGVFYNVFTKENGAIVAKVELNDENEAHMFWAFLDGETVVDEERIYGQDQ